MADERCVFPGDDESPSGSAARPRPGRRPGRWLDRRTAERLLRGDAPDNAVAPAHRDEAERLARTLNALAALSDPPVPPDEELPGEAAALAAFRKIQADRTTPSTVYVESREPRESLESRDPETAGPDADDVVAAGTGTDTGADVTIGLGEVTALSAFRSARAASRPGTAAASSPYGTASRLRNTPDDGADDGADDGVVRIGAGRPERERSRRSRSARLGAAAALAVGMVGGVAVATGAGVLPTPFDDSEPGPVASVSAAATPGPPRPNVSPSPSLSPSPAPGAGRSDQVAPDAPNGPASGAPAAPSAGGNAKGSGGDAPDARDNGTWPVGVPSACRDLRDGKVLHHERRRTLENAAGGFWRVPVYCAHVLTARGGGGTTGSQGQGQGQDQNGWGGHDGGTSGGWGSGWGDGTSGQGDKSDEDGQGNKGSDGGRDEDGKGGKDGQGGNGGRGGSGH